MALLVDTCVLVAAFHPGSPDHQAVRQALRNLQASNERLIVTPQNCAVLWNVSTRPLKYNGRGLSAGDAQRMVSIVKRVSEIVYETPEAFDRWRELVEKYNVQGVAVHDARLVAVMLASNVSQVLTLNDRDFRRYEPEGIQAVAPASLGPQANP